MHLRKILAVLVLFATSSDAFAVGYVMTAFDQGAGSAVRVATNPVREVDTLLRGLNRQVHSRMPASAKIQVMRATLQEIDALRKAAPLQSVDKEIYLDFSTDSLRHVTEDREFSTAKCANYKARLLIDFEPSSQDRPANPALLRSYKIIEGLCS